MRVILADDSVLLREGLMRLLADAGHETVAAVGDAQALLNAIDEHSPDVAVIDVRMPPTHTDEGLRAALEIRRHHPGIGVLVLSQYVEKTYAARLLAGDAEGLGYLLKDRVTEVLRHLAQGYVNTAIAERLHVSLSTVEKHIHSLMDKLELPRDPGYSRRVLAILRYLDK